jgi:hypothetical protein
MMPLRAGLALSLIALTCLAAAGTADASQVTLWACHGPGGQPLGASVFGFGSSSGFAGALKGPGCDGPGSAYADGALTARLSDATGGGFAVMTVGTPKLPLNVALDSVTLLRRTLGVQRRSVTADDVELDAGSDEVDGLVTLPLPKPAPVNQVRVGVDCAVAPCDGEVDVQRVGLTVDDTTPPYGAANDIASDMYGIHHVGVWASDVGVGLSHADLYVDGVEVGSGSYGDGTCADLSPDDPAIDLPLGADCPLTSRDVSIALDTTNWADGPHTLTIKLYDAAGNETDVVKDYATTFSNFPDHGTPTQTLTLGSGAGRPGGSGGSGAGSGGTGGVAGASATSCGSPKLSMYLSQKPLAVSHGVPVLRHGKRYRFRGRLTCVVSGKRRAAPKHTRIDLLNQIGSRTYAKGGTTVRDGGNITIILAYRSSRTLVFRYTSPEGKRSQVKIKIKVKR